VEHKKRRKHLVIFQPSGRRGYIGEGKTIMEASQELGVDLENVCGGRATCGVSFGCFRDLTNIIKKA